MTPSNRAEYIRDEWGGLAQFNRVNRNLSTIKSKISKQKKKLTRLMSSGVNLEEKKRRGKIIKSKIEKYQKRFSDVYDNLT